MQIPFNSSTNKSYLKIYYDANFADKTYINSSNSTANIAIAKDNISVSFVAFPNKYNLNYRANIDDKIPLSGMEGTINSLFLLELDKRVESVKLVQSNFLINGTDYGYLKFIEQSYPDETQIEKYTFDDVSILSLTNQQYQELLQLKNQEFPDDYKVYLSLDNIDNDIDDNGNSYTKFDCILTGLKDDGSGNIISHSAIPSPAITLYTDKKISGAEYSRNYEETIGIGYDLDTNINNEDYFINKQNPVRNVVDDFINKINNINSSSGEVYQAIRALVSSKGAELWQIAVQTVQANPSQPDDRPLYWGRLKMGVAIKKHAYFRGDIDTNSDIITGSQLDEIIKLFEEKSRNYTGVDFSGAPSGAKKVLITGFDPFFLNPSTGNILQSNPSGCVALSLHSSTTNNTLGYIQAMVVPVRFRDFDSSLTDVGGPGEGIIEKHIAPLLSQVDMIVTISQSLPGHYDIDRYATVSRGATPDNLNENRVWLSRSIEIDNSNLEWIETTLPDEFIADGVVYNFEYYDSNNSFHVNIDGLDPPVVGERMNSGPGGNYLSNEIFYRVAKLRVAFSSDFPTGHFHISKIQNGTDDFSGPDTQALINIVKNAFNNAVIGL